MDNLAMYSIFGVIGVISLYFIFKKKESVPKPPE